MRSFILSIVLCSCALSNAQVKKIAQDAAGFSLCLQVCIANSDFQEDYTACADRCEKKFGVQHGPVEQSVLDALNGR